MPTPVQRIRAGIDAIDGVTSNADRLSALGKRHSTPTQFKTLLAGVIKDTRELSRMDKIASDKRTAGKAAIKADWDTKGWIDSQTGVGRMDQMGATARMQFVNNDIAKMEKGIVAEHRPLAAPLAAKLADARSHIQAGMIIFADPVSLLTRKTAGQAAKVLEQFSLIATAGPKHLEAYSILAAQTGGEKGEAMAQAVGMRADQLDRKTRQSLTFSKADVAEVAVGVEWRRIAATLAIADYVVSQGLLHNKSLQGKKVGAQDRINIGMALGNAESKVGRKLIDEGTGEIIADDPSEQQ